MFDQPCCQNPDCGLPILVTGGHRPRKYCNNACKQAAHRARLREAERVREEEDRLARIQAERILLLSRYGNLLPQTLDLLQSFQSRALIEQVIAVIRAEQEWARQTELQTRSAIIEALLLAGEQIGFPTLTNDDFEVEAGVDHWLSFIEEADLGELYQACDIVHIKVQAAAGWRNCVESQAIVTLASPEVRVTLALGYRVQGRPLPRWTCRDLPTIISLQGHVDPQRLPNFT